MKRLHFLLTSVFLLFLMSCSNIVSVLEEPKIEDIKKGTTEIKMVIPDYQAMAEGQTERVIAPQTKSVRLSYKQNDTNNEQRWFEVSTIALDKVKGETIIGAKPNFPGKIYTFTFNGLELGNYNIGDLKIDLLDSDGNIVSSGINNTQITVSLENKSSTTFFTLPVDINGSHGTLKAGEMKFISIAVLDGLEYTFKINSTGDYPDVVLFSEDGQFEDYIINDNEQSSSISFKSNATGIKYLGVWADDGKDISSYSIDFNSTGGTLLKDAVLSGADLHWTKANSPYYITKNTLVDETSELIIDPGVQVFVTGNYYLKVTGGIKAMGTKQEPIVFMKSIDNIGNWEGIQINSSKELITTNDYQYSSGNIFNYCNFVCANAPLHSNSSIYVSNCQFANNNKGLDVGNETSSVVINNELKDGLIGDFQSSDCKIINNKIYKKASSRGYYKNNTFIDCSVNVYRSWYTTKFENNIFNNCRFADNFDSDFHFNFNNFIDCHSPIFSTSSSYTSGSTYDITNNYWGDKNTLELKENADSNNKNVSFIQDYYDDFNVMRYDYSGWVDKPFENCGYLGDKLILFDFSINGKKSSITETKNTKLRIVVEPKLFNYNISEIRYAQSLEELNMASWVPYNDSFDYVIKPENAVDGEVYVYIQLKDAASNTSSIVQKKLPFDIPTINFSIKENQKIDGKLDFYDCKISVLDKGGFYNSNVKITLDGISYGALNADNTFRLPIKHMSGGTHALKINATDHAENTASSCVNFIIDRNVNLSEYEGKSYNIDSGEFIKDNNTSYLWHFNNDAKAEGDESASVTSYQAAIGGISGYASSALISPDDQNNNINPIINNSFTVEYWSCNPSFYFEGSKSKTFFICNYNNDLGFYSTFQSYCNNADGTLTNYNTNKNFSIATNQIYHYWSYIYDGKSLSVYCDGVLAYYMDNITKTLNNTSNKMKLHLTNIDELRISKNARSADEIASYYNVANPIINSVK